MNILKEDVANATNFAISGWILPIFSSFKGFDLQIIVVFSFKKVNIK